MMKNYKITFLHPGCTVDHLGLVPAFLDPYDERPAREQFDENYAHGGGWRPLKGWSFNPGTRTIHYPGDPALKAIARFDFGDEVIYAYPSAWFCIVQPDGSFEVARMD